MSPRVLAGIALAMLVSRAALADPIACAVRWREGATAAWSELPPHTVRPLLASPSGGPAKASHSLAGWTIVTFDDAPACAAALARFRHDPRIAACEPIRTFQLCGAGSTRPATEIPPNVRQVRAPEALQRIVPDSSIIVAVIDTGADLTHPDLIRRLWRNDDPPGNGRLEDDGVDQNGDGIVEAWERDDDDNNGYVDDQHGFDFTDAPGKGAVGDALDPDADPSDEHGHGTHVAGIIAADGELRGVAPFVRLMPVRAAYTTAFGGGVLETDDAAAAIVYAVDNGARILNLSWGDREDALIVREALAYAAARGVVIVAAAGNGATNAPHFPSGDPNALAVGAVDELGVRAAFSNFGPGITLAAPGEKYAGLGGGITSLAPGGGRADRRGTSMAAPHVAGIAAIVLSRADRPDAGGVRAALVAGARGAPGWSDAIGHGVADAVGAVDAGVALFLAVNGPQIPFRFGKLTLMGTVLGGDLERWRIDVHRLGDSVLRPVLEWQSEALAGGTLVSVELPGAVEGDWEYIVRAETGAGEVAERHGPFRVDFTAPVLDTLAVESGWRGAQPRTLITLRADDAVTAVLIAGTDTLRGGEAGFGQRAQFEVPNTTPATSIRCTNAAGLATDTTFVSPAPRASWPRGGRLIERDAIPGWFADPVWGTTPAGIRVVWGRGGVPATVQGFTHSLAGPTSWHDTGSDGIPVGYADVSGDGVPDLLLRRGRDIIEWWGARAGGEVPDSLLASARAERALGLFQLDGDAAHETLLSSRDSLFILDDLRNGAPRRLQALVNPAATGFTTWGADVAAGDLDGDGAVEIASGDAGGSVTVFERNAFGSFELAWSRHSDGVYAYDFTTLPEGGFLVGRQRGVNPAGDGFPTALYEFIREAPAAMGYEAADRWAFLSPANDLGAGSSAAASPATGAAWLALVRGEDLYLLRGLAAARTYEVHLPNVARRAPALLDWDQDGSLDVVVRSTDGTRFLTIEEDARGPHDLRATSLGAGRIRLDWTPGTGSPSRVRRRLDQGWTNLGETTAATWVDSTVATSTEYEYEIQSTGSGGLSNRIRARAQPRPRLLGAQALGSRSLRVTLSQPLHPEAEVDRWHARDSDRRIYRVVQLTRTAAGREAILLLEAPPACGTVTIIADGIRDDQNGLLDPAVDSTHADFVCPSPTFAVRDVRFVGRDIEVRFSTPPGATAFEPARYALSWNGARLAIAAVRALDPTRLVLEPAAEVQFVGRGVPYLLRLDAAIRAADGTVLAYADTEHVLRVEGRGARHVVAWPNPARREDSAIIFADAGPATRITIYDLEGERVRSLTGASGGGIRWDLRDGDGRIVPSGVYLFVAKDGTGTQRGRVALLR